jgi:hypothetical protein
MFPARALLITLLSILLQNESSLALAEHCNVAEECWRCTDGDRGEISECAQTGKVELIRCAADEDDQGK